MPTETDICNLAFDALNVEPITSLADQNKRGRIANRTYAQHRDSLTQAHEWRFAIERQRIPGLTDPPLFGADVYYPLPEFPSKSLRVLEVDGQDIDFPESQWKIEGRSILSSISSTEGGTIDIRFIAQQENTGLMPPQFVDALAAKLAYEWALVLTESSTIRAELRIDMLTKMQDAKAIISQESMPDILESSRWIKARN